MKKNQLLKNKKILFTVAGVVLVGAMTALAYFSNAALFKGYLISPINQKILMQPIQPAQQQPQYQYQPHYYTMQQQPQYQYQPHYYTMQQQPQYQYQPHYYTMQQQPIQMQPQPLQQQPIQMQPQPLQQPIQMQPQPLQQPVQMQPQPLQQPIQMQPQPLKVQPQPLQVIPAISTDCTVFKDLKTTDPDCAAIGYMNSIGAMTGNPDGNFAPNAYLQRDQVAKIILVAFKLYDNGTTYCNASPFPDVSAQDWSYQYLCAGTAEGLITGYQSGPDKGFYRPPRYVNRVEFLALLLRALGDKLPGNDSTSYGDVPANQWYSGYAKYALDQNLFPGSNLFPTNFTTRREVARVIYTLHQEGKY